MATFWEIVPHSVGLVFLFVILVIWFLVAPVPVKCLLVTFVNDTSRDSGNCLWIYKIKNKWFSVPVFGVRVSVTSQLTCVHIIGFGC